MVTSTPFHNLTEFVALPRITGLVLSPDGGRLIATVQQLNQEQDGYQSSLWEIDPTGGAPTRRLTHSAAGETQPAFTADGSLLFCSQRPGPEGEPPDEPALWRLPQCGEAIRVATSPGGLGGAVTARAAAGYLVGTTRLAGVTEPEDAQWRADRKASKVSAIIHDGFPVRRWDRELGPDRPALLAGRLDDDAPPRDLAPDAGPALLDARYDLTADGSTAVTDWWLREPGGRSRCTLVAIDVATGERRPLADDPPHFDSGPKVAPDGRAVAAARLLPGDADTPAVSMLCVHDLVGGPVRSFQLTEELSPTEYVWSPDSGTLYVAGDRRGRGAVLALDVATGAHRLIATDAVYSQLSVSPDGAAIYALRSAVDCPPQPVRLDAAATLGAPTYLPSPAPRPELPGTLVEVEAAAPGGATVRGWLVLPTGDEPAPLQQWIHGGPFMSFNNWSWRWCPWIAAARGWAVLMPDPALSTGYGHAWITRAWPHRAEPVWRDVEALLDTVVARADIDADRTACLGASFGGYMANWVAGHTDRFRAIVSHCGLWAADQQHATTDMAAWKTRLIGTLAENPQWYAENSPHRFADSITTPMLVVHGNRDYRVPVSEALRLFWDLASRHQGDPETLPHRFLQFTAEGHWVLSPNNARIWYETILAFLEWHVLGGEWSPPPLSGRS